MSRATKASRSEISEAAVSHLRDSFQGELIQPGDPDYDQARKVWNGMFDKRPALVARCGGVADVRACVDFARENDVLVAIRSGGHSIPGFSVCDDGIVIDLARMQAVRVDPERKTAQVQAGALLGTFDREAQAFGLATTAGVVSHTGLAGLTLGGGVGYLMRKYGLTCDNLLAADVVTADGRFVTASEDENSELLWGLRGGGGNFGVVTSFTYQLHKVGPTVLAGLLIHPFERAADVLGFYREYVRGAPDELSTFVGVSDCPPEPLFPEDLHGKPIVSLVMCWVGAQEDGEKALAPLRAYGPPTVDLIRPMSYLELQSFQDETLAWGKCYYNKNMCVEDLSDEVIATIIEHIALRTSPESWVAIMLGGGAASRVPPENTAFPIRQAPYTMDIGAIWTHPDEPADHIEWARRFYDAMQPFATGAFYVNTAWDEGDEGVRTTYSQNYDRLVALKNEYDPTNLFRLNQNIKPTVAA
jgi:FAD/FMN-containing dehydrogenase